MAAAHPGLYLNASTPLFPPEKLEIDMRGHTRFAYIDIGMVAETDSFEEAVEQLGLRLGVLRWLLLQDNGHLGADMMLVGRLFCAWSSVGDGGDNRVPVDLIWKGPSRSGAWRAGAVVCIRTSSGSRRIVIT
jgi:hypothetical protein